MTTVSYLFVTVMLPVRVSRGSRGVGGSGGDDEILLGPVAQDVLDVAVHGGSLARSADQLTGTALGVSLAALAHFFNITRAPSARSHDKTSDSQPLPLPVACHVALSAYNETTTAFKHRLGWRFNLFNCRE